METENLFDGSGKRALEENQSTKEALEKQLEVLQERTAAGEIVDKEIEIIRAKAKKLNEDIGRINSAGM